MKFILLFTIILSLPFSTNGQSHQHPLSTEDSLSLYFKIHKLKPLYKSGNYDQGCEIFEELVNNNIYTRTSMLYGGKCCFKMSQDSLVMKIFTEKNRSTIQDFCRLNWGDNVENDTAFIKFCEVDMDKYDCTKRSVLNLKLVSDTLVQILIEDQGIHLSNGLKNNLIKNGYEKLFSLETPKPNALELNNHHVKIIKRILRTYPNISKQDIGKYGMDGIAFTLLHSKLENLIKFEAVYAKLFGKSMQAYYQDKIFTAKGEEQHYGTQFQYCDSRKKNLLYPVFEIENLHLRRMRMDLPPIEDYAKYNRVADYHEVCE